MTVSNMLRTSAITLAASLSLSSFGFAQAPAQRPPNIVFFLADDLGVGDVGCYGQDKIKTPNIDALAKRGMRFTQAYSPQAVSAPARCGFLTGMHMGHAAVRDNREWKQEGQFPLSEDAITIFNLAKTKNYTTGDFGKWGLGMPETTGSTAKKGLDQFFGPLCQRKAHFYYPPYMWDNDKQVFYEGNHDDTGNVYAQDAIDEQMLKFMDNNKSKPFLLYISTTLPHVSLQITDKELNEYKGKFPEKPFAKQHYSAQDNPHAAYAAMVTRLDTIMGKIVDKLHEQGIEDNTLIVFTSDNGATYNGGTDTEFFKSNLNYRSTKGYLYEGGIHEPLVVAWPGKIKPGTVSDLPVAGYDLFPTFCDVMDIEKPKNIDGVSILPTLTGQGTQIVHDFLYWEFPSYGHQQAVRMGNWKALRQRMVGKMTRLTNQNAKLPQDQRKSEEEIIKEVRQIELYDLSTDPSESKDVAAEHPDIVAKAAKIMDEQHVANPNFPLITYEKVNLKLEQE